MLKFLIGIACGIGLGFLIAPQEGSETHEQLARLATDPMGVAREKVADIRQKAGDVGARMGRQAAEKAVDKVVPENLGTGTEPGRP